MNYETEANLVAEFYNQCYEIIKSKAHDYASQDDCFSNFKSIAEMCRTPINKVFLQFIAVKLARLVELCGSNKITQHESIEDSLKDICNYSCLMAIYLKMSEAD